MVIKSTLFDFWKKKEIEWGRTITVAEVARSASLSRDTIRRLKSGHTSRFDGPIISKLCNFFDVPAGPIPFLIYTPDHD